MLPLTLVYYRMHREPCRLSSIDLHYGLFNVYVVAADEIVAMLTDTRVFELLDLSRSTSANKRHHLTLYAKQAIAAHPLLGGYASYQLGYYAHDVLSAWVDPGLFGFVYLLVLTAVPGVPMFFKE
jgi:hypothetical protein